MQIDLQLLTGYGIQNCKNISHSICGNSNISECNFKIYQKIVYC